MKKRTQLAADANQAYWLPPATECAVAALRCPDHFKTKRTAKVEYDGENCVIGFEGATRCELMCLKLYEGCTTPSHVCLEKCHIQSREADDKHKCCPYPCRKTLPCGHGCHANCGDPCGPCGFTGLHKLKCGQRVISGITTDQVMQYTFFNHFQKSACGDAHRNCEEKVAHTCSRCGVKSLICCTVLTNLYCRAKQDANDTSTTETRAEPTEEAPPQGEPTDYGEMADFTLPENYCVGCVQLYNKVCSAFGYEAYPTPDLEKLTAIELGEEGEEEEVLAGASLPRHTRCPTRRRRN
ncbi:hypothetical protein ADEAN_000529600 [Angomonas deanei]|uniref:Uncharacterized protein n=1 Tax=Angomonas deanei TaxID=59799 RepID=A0A7G2CGJ3_9TRYP|nr:hypothetical protein ADEAN_000529600 [Angomonas deanei]